MRRSGLLLLALACACGGGGKPPPPPPPDPPHVTVTAPSASVVDTQLTFSVSVTGCDTLSTLEILNGGQPMFGIGWSGNPTPVTLTPSQVSFAAGIPAQLELSATVTCNDGRTDTSAPIPVAFFPVAAVFSHADGTPVVTDQFYAEGSGSGASFVGCSGQANGTNTLVRVDATGVVIGSANNPPIACDGSSWFTDKTATGLRWMVQPTVGAMAFNSNLSAAGYFLVSNGVTISSLGMGSDGDAVISFGNLASNFRRVSQTTGNAVWAAQLAGSPMTNPVVTVYAGSPTVFVAELVNNLSAHQAAVTVERFDYTTGNLVGTYTQSTLDYGSLGTPPKLPAAFSPDGSQLYFAYPAPDNQSSVVVACASTGTGCGTPLWQTSGLAGVVTNTFAISNATRLAALAPQDAWILDVTNGTPVTVGGNPITPTSNLMTVGFEGGAAKDLYVLNGTGPGQATEIVGFDDPAAPELFRYDTLAGTVTVAVDEGGQPWMRIGPNLVQLLTLAQYRALR